MINKMHRVLIILILLVIILLIVYRSYQVESYETDPYISPDNSIKSYNLVCRVIRDGNTKMAHLNDLHDIKVGDQIMVV